MFDTSVPEDIRQEVYATHAEAVKWLQTVQFRLSGTALDGRVTTDIPDITVTMDPSDVAGLQYIERFSGRPAYENPLLSGYNFGDGTNIFISPYYGGVGVPDKPIADRYLHELAHSVFPGLGGNGTQHYVEF